MDPQKQEVKHSEEQFRRLFDQNPIPNWIYDLDSLCILEVNKEAVRHYGYSRKQFLSMTIRDLRPAADQEELTATLNRIKKNRKGKHGFWRHIKKDGEIIVVDITGLAIDFDGRNARMVICQDVTQRLEAEAALLISNERFRYAIKASSDAIWDWDIKNSTVFLGEGFKGLFGYDEAGTVVGRSWITDRFHPLDLKRVLDKLERTVNGSIEDRWADEYRFRKADGSFALICNTALLIRDENAQPLRLIGAMRDVTESRAQLQAIQTQNDQLREIAWFQSHIVRAPLARLIGLVDLAISDPGTEELSKMLPLLKSSAEELDTVIKEIVNKTTEIEIPKAG